MNELQQVFGHTVQEEDEGVKDEFHSLFDAYGLKNATIETFDIVPIKKSPTVHRHGLSMTPGCMPPDVSTAFKFKAKFKLSSASFYVWGTMCNTHDSLFDVDGVDFTTRPNAWRWAMDEKLENYTDMDHVLHTVSYNKWSIVPKWVEDAQEATKEAEAKAEYEEDYAREEAKALAHERRQMGDTVVMTRFDKAALMHKAAKCDHLQAELDALRERTNAQESMHNAVVQDLDTKTRHAQESALRMKGELANARVLLRKAETERVNEVCRQAMPTDHGWPDNVSAKRARACYAWAEAFNPDRLD